MHRQARSWGLWAVVLALLAAGLTAREARAQNAPGQGLFRAGPLDPSNGFPLWYMDHTGLVLQLCLDPQDPFCPLATDTLTDPAAPVVFPGNFPEEAFWWTGDASMTTAGGGNALLVLAAEAAFANGPVVNGDQVSFARVRIRVDNLQPGATYRVIHPYGVNVFTNVAGGRRGINFTEDIGIGAPGDFTGILNGRVGPFLVWDPMTDAPAGYVGNPNVSHRVTGSPFGTNVFRIEGPNVRDPGPAFACPDRPTDVNCMQTDLFVIAGKVATISGAGVGRATYTRDATGTAVDVFASTLPGKQLQVAGASPTPTAMRSDAAGNSFARLQLAGAPPAQVQVLNVSDSPPSVVTVQLRDLVTIGRAVYDDGTHQLRIEATSSDTVVNPTLTAQGFGTLTGGVLVVADVAVPPTQVVVSSSQGGRTVRDVEVIGAAAPGGTVVADAGTDQTVQGGGTVTLNGGASTGTGLLFFWGQVSGTPVTLSGVTSPTPSFTAPATAGTLVFQLTVTGPGGTSTDTVSVVVQGGPVVQAPVANAGPDQQALAGQSVTLDGSASLRATTFQWTQIAGPAVTLVGPTTASPTFLQPAGGVTLTFRLTVTNAAGSSSDTVSIITPAEALTVTEATFVTSTRSWRVRGNIVGGVPGETITIHVGSTLTGPILGTATLRDNGSWIFQNTNSLRVPDGTRTVSVRTSGGSRQLGVRVTVK